MNRKPTPSKTIRAITTAARTSPVASETAARAVNRITSGLRHAIKSRQTQPRSRSWATSLGPYCSIRRSTSSWLRPDADVSSVLKTSSGSRRAQSTNSGETLIPAPLLPGNDPPRFIGFPSPCDMPWPRLPESPALSAHRLIQRARNVKLRPLTHHSFHYSSTLLTTHHFLY